MNTSPRDDSHNLIEPELAGTTQDIHKPQWSTDIGEGTSLARVRDILFGNQMWEIEKKFTRLEERLVKECVSLRDENRRRLDALEIYIKKEVEFITQRLTNEPVEREQAVKALAEEHKNLAMSLEKKLAQFEQKTIHSQQHLQEQIHQQCRNLQDEIQQKYAEILVLLQKESQELHQEKTNRSTLANLFAELAIRLNSQD